ncbi:hypothetical protein VKT23_018066 [Stygiomarasmius scandens]|uniref:Pheromone receptor n=1 Tax=Marasmiellus scandens TaxID=2682957 RepID=A0ABR1IQL1_9AGAR
MANVTESVLTRDDADIIGKTIIAEAVHGLCYGVECLFFIAALYKLSRRGLRNSTTRTVLVLIIMIIFLSSTATIVSNLIQDVVQIIGLGNPEYDFGPAKLKSNIASTFTTRISYLLGDTIVVWRAWILFDGQPYFRLVLAACLLSTLSGVIVNIVFSMRSLLERGFRPKPGPRIILPATLLVTNIVATSFIIYRIWHYRHSIKKDLGCSDSRRTKIEKILILLVETGFLYSILWVRTRTLFARRQHFPIHGSCQICDLIALTNPQFYDFSVFLGTILPHAAGIYPTAIILLSASQKSYCDTTLQGELPTLSIQTKQSQGASQPIRFASAPPRRYTSDPSATELGMSRFTMDDGLEQATPSKDGSHENGFGHDSPHISESKPEVTSIV